jgi:tetratricopeptide (TPR) repeat protein
MNADRLGDLFGRAMALPRDERTAFLESACADAALREELTSLLAAHDESDGFFERVMGRVVEPLLAAEPVVPDFVSPGDVVDRYEIRGRLGSGGMGVVYEAWDGRLNRTVALKFLSPSLIGDEAAYARLVAEARAVSALDHPGIAVVHDVGTTDGGHLYVAMTHYAGETLNSLLAEGRLPIDEAVDIATQLAAALAVAHEAGVVHRDVKPSNVLVTTRGVAKLLDFGIAKVAGADVTREGATLGTLTYMSPEQTRGEAVDGRTDVWSLGVLLYEMLTGRRPFQGDDDAVVIHAIRNDEPPDVALLRPDVPRALAAIARSCLSKDPDGRPQRAEDLHAAFIACREDRPVRGARTTRPSWRPGRRALASALTGLTALIGIGAYRTLAGGSGPVIRSDRIVVAAFENHTGQPALDWVGRAAADWLIQGLSETGLVDVVPTTAALSASRYAEGGSAGEDTMARVRLLGEETGAGIVVTGAYYLQGDSLYLRATVTDRAGERVLNAIERIATTSIDPIGGIEELRRRAMSVLAGRLDARMQEHALMLRSAPSFQAYRAYLSGMDAFVSEDFRAAIGHFTEAAALDPGFDLPIFYTGLSFANLGRHAAVDSILDLLRPLEDGLAPATRLAVAWMTAMQRGDLMEGYRTSRRITDVMPDGMAHANHINASNWVNRPAEAVRVARQLDPERGELRGWASYWMHLTTAHHLLGQHRQELRTARRGRALIGSGHEILIEREASALAALGRTRALSDFLAMQEDEVARPAGLVRLAGLELLAHGAAADGRAMLRQSLDMALVREETPLFLAQAYILTEQYEAAEPLLRQLAEQFPGSWIAHGWIGVLAARRGDAEEARAMDAWLAELDRPYVFGQATHMRARIAALLGERDRAVALLEQAFREGYGEWPILHIEPDFATLRTYPPFRELVRPRG